VVFLAATGGVPVAVAQDVQAWLSAGHAEQPAAPVIESGAFDCAHRLLAAVALGIAGDDVAIGLAELLLGWAHGGGGWAPSAVLLVPLRYTLATTDPAGMAPPQEVGPHADARGLMTTSIASVALAEWLATTKSGHSCTGLPL